MAILTFQPENVTDFTIKVRILFYTKIVKFLFQKTLKARKFCHGGSFKAFKTKIHESSVSGFGCDGSPFN